MPEETIEPGAGGEITVTTTLEEKPEVTPSGNIGQPTQAELKAYAKSLLADEYDLTPKGQGAADCWPGTDIPKKECPEYGDMAEGEQASVRFSWRMMKQATQASAQHASTLSAPALKAQAIAEISEGLSDKEVSALKKAIKEMEDETESTFAPTKVTPAMKKQWQRMAKGAALEGPPESPNLKKEPAGDQKLDLTEQELAVYNDYKKMGVNITPERIREMSKNGWKTEGYVAHKEKVSA